MVDLWWPDVIHLNHSPTRPSPCLHTHTPTVFCSSSPSFLSLWSDSLSLLTSANETILFGSEDRGVNLGQIVRGQISAESHWFPDTLHSKGQSPRSATEQSPCSLQWPSCHPPWLFITADTRPPALSRSAVNTAWSLGCTGTCFIRRRVCSDWLRRTLMFNCWFPSSADEDPLEPWSEEDTIKINKHLI